MLPPALQGGPNDNTQTGGGVGYSHQLSGMTSFVANASFNRTTSNVSEGFLGDASSNNTTLSAGLATRFGPKTTGSAGVSYTSYRPNSVLDSPRVRHVQRLRRRQPHVLGAACTKPSTA